MIYGDVDIIKYPLYDYSMQNSVTELRFDLTIFFSFNIKFGVSFFKIYKFTPSNDVEVNYTRLISQLKCN